MQYRLDVLSSAHLARPSAGPDARDGSQLAVLIWQAAGLFALAIPLLMVVARNAIAAGSGAHLIFIAAGGIWLLVDGLRGAPVSRPSLRSTLILLVPLLLLYMFCRMTGIEWVGWAAVCAIAALLVRDRYGVRGLGRAVLPLCLLFCLVPPPIELVVPVTDNLVALTTKAAAAGLRLIGMDAAIATPMLYINQYELQVADACAGLGTLFSLTVCILLYAHLRHRDDWRHALLLGALAVPIALAANLLRILLIGVVIATLGDAWAQGILHDAAGLLLFAMALSSLLLIDWALTLAWQKAA